MIQLEPRQREQHSFHLPFCSIDETAFFTTSALSMTISLKLTGKTS
jgi:hypothetical protein